MTSGIKIEPRNANDKEVLQKCKAEIIKILDKYKVYAA